MDKKGKTHHSASVQHHDDKGNSWASNMKIMNQIKETTTTDVSFLTTTDLPTTEIVTTEKSNKSDETTIIPETSTFDPQTTTNIFTTMNDLTTTDKYDTTTDISTTEEASTIESTTFEVDDRIDPKVIDTLLG